MREFLAEGMACAKAQRCDGQDGNRGIAIFSLNEVIHRRHWVWQRPGPWKVVDKSERASPQHMQGSRSWAHLHMYVSQMFSSREFKLLGFPYLTWLKISRPLPHLALSSAISTPTDAQPPSPVLLWTMLVPIELPQKYSGKGFSCVLSLIPQLV